MIVVLSTNNDEPSKLFKGKTLLLKFKKGDKATFSTSVFGW
jgi:hypothetical protein